MMKKQLPESPQESFLSRDPVKATQEMLKTIDILRDICVEETMALRSADTKTFFLLQDRKIEAAQNYHAALSEILSRKEEIIRSRPQIKSILNKKQEEFSAVTGENLKAINRMRQTVTRLGNRIRETARDSALRDSVSYGAQGNLTAYKNKPVTMGLNESA